MRLKDQPASERPRERLVEKGADALSHAELVAILLRTGLRGSNALDIGKELVTKYSSLHALALASVDELQAVRGIGPDKAVTLVAAFTLARKMAEGFQRLSAFRQESREPGFKEAVDNYSRAMWRGPCRRRTRPALPLQAVAARTDDAGEVQDHHQQE